MLRQGLFIDETGVEYTIYEQSVDGFNRMDFCEKDANFHTDIAAIKFSIVKQKDTFIYGDRNLYRSYSGLVDAAQQLHVASETTHDWKLGKYYTRIVRSQPSSQFLEETVQCNGKPDSYTLQFGEKIYTIWVVAEYSESRLLPLNYPEYERVALEAESVSNGDAPYYSLSVLKARHDIAHLDECDYVVADNLELARERLQRWINADVRLKGIDTETTGTDVDMYGEDKMVGIILSYDKMESTYFPFGHKKFDNLTEEFLHKELMPAIKKEEYRLVAHNKKFERKVFLRLGWSIYIKYDTMPLSFMVNPVIERGAHALKNLMYRVTGKVFLELDHIFVSPKLIDFSVLPKEIVRLYACPDASSLLVLFPHLWAQLPAYSRKITEVEFDLADVKADQEYYGLRVDVERFMKNLDNCDYTMKMLLQAFRAITGVDGNINSTEVLSNLIFGKMCCPVFVRTKTGKPSTGAASIKKLSGVKIESERSQMVEGDLCDLNGKPVVKAKDLNNAKYPALVILEKYRVYNKLRTAFYSRFERTKRSGRVFFWVNQNGATSGRQSSPMHQLPPELKDIILSDTPDHDMWDPDYSQIELRMIAFLAGEKELIELCKDPENDIHRAIGSLISNKEMWQISSEERKVGKRRNFGVVYMISAHGLAAQIAGAGYGKSDVDDADRSLNDFYHRFKRIKKYIAQNAEKVKSQGYITTYFGRNRYFREIFDPEITARKKSSLIRQANNLPVQGTAADYLKLAETNFNTYIRNRGWDSLLPTGFPRVRVALSIHDEVLLMADQSIPYEEIILMIRTCMEMPIEGAPPFFCAPALVATWAQHDDDSVAMPVLLRDQLIADYTKTSVSVFKRSLYRISIEDANRSKLEEELRGATEKSRKKILAANTSMVRWEYVSGDNGTVISTIGKLAALSSALLKGSTNFWDSNYMEILNLYRDKVLQEYMRNLIQRWGKDPTVVAEHVRHPSLTHELIARYPTPKDSDFDHEGCILYAAEKYIQGEAASPQSQSTKETTETLEDLTALQVLVNFDSEGNAVYEAEEDSVVEEVQDPYDDERFISELTDGEKVYVWELMDALCVDISSISDAAANSVIQKVWESRDPDGFFRVMFIRNEMMLDSKFRVEDIDKISLTDYIKEVRVNDTQTRSGV